MHSTQKRDLKNIEILCKYWSGDMTEEDALSSLILKQTTKQGKDKYIKKLIAIIRDEERMVKARREADGKG